MQKFFKDNTSETQFMTRQSIKLIFKLSDDIIDKVIKDEKFIVLYNYSDKNYSIQICINTKESYDNNNYLNLIFDIQNNLIFFNGYKSHTIYPPVWNREYGYIDYTDFLGIQKTVNQQLTKYNLPIIEYDFSLKNRCFYFTEENPLQEIPELLKQGKSYHIYSILAEAKPELAILSRKMIEI